MRWGYIYPGTIWTKRLKHFIVLSCISLSLWVNELQDRLLQDTQDIIEQTSDYLPVMTNVCHYVEKTLPLYERIERSSLAIHMQDIDLPNSASLRDKITKVRSLEKSVIEMNSLFSHTSLILEVLTWIMLLQILYSLTWVFQDMKYGEQKMLMAGLISISLGLNIVAKDYLNTITSLL